MKQSKGWLGIVLILLSGIIWGFISLPVDYIKSQGLKDMEVVFLRSGSTALVLGLFCLFSSRSTFRIKLKDIWCFFGTGIGSIMFFNFCYFKSIDMMGAPIACVLMYTAPFFVVALAAICFKERITVQKAVACMVAFAGCALVSGLFGGNGSVTAEGLVWGLMTGFGYGLYTIFGRYALDRGYSSLTITLYTFMIAALGSACFINPLKVVGVAVSGIGPLAMTLEIAAVSTLLPYTLYAAGMRFTDAGNAPIISSVEIVVATIMGVVVRKDTLDIYAGIGILLILAAVVLLNLNLKKKNQTTL